MDSLGVLRSYGNDESKKRFRPVEQTIKGSVIENSCTFDEAWKNTPIDFVAPQAQKEDFDLSQKRNLHPIFRGEQRLDRCFYCHIPIGKKNRSKDHVNPRSKGGKTNCNIIICCKDCNLSKSSFSLEEWRELLLKGKLKLRRKDVVVQKIDYMIKKIIQHRLLELTK